MRRRHPEIRKVPMNRFVSDLRGFQNLGGLVTDFEKTGARYL